MTSLWNAASPDLVVHGDNLDAMRRLPDGAFQVIYLDPPFNTGKQQTRQSVKVKRQSPVEESVEAAELGDRNGQPTFGDGIHCRRENRQIQLQVWS